MSIEEENKACIRIIAEEVFNKGNLAVVDEHIAANWVYLGPAGDYKGTEGFKQMVSGMRTIFPDIHFTVDDMIGEGNKLAVRYTWTGTFKGKFGDIEPTGKQVKVSFAYFYRFEDGKEAEVMGFGDTLSLYQQMDISPPGQ